MKFGSNLYAFTRFGDDLPATLEFVRTAEALGYHHLRFVDHVVGIAPRPDDGANAVSYDDRSHLQEVMTFLAYLAAITSTIRLVPAVVVLPMRQTVLVAKQAAQIDILSGGRLTLGVGVGYSPREFEALGVSLEGRGRRFEEQVQVLRALWTEEVVTFQGEFHTIRGAALAPRPLQRPIPLWFGMGRAHAPIPGDGVLRRAGRLADGVMPLFGPGPEGRAAIQTIHAAAREAGRDPSRIALEMPLEVRDKSRQALVDEVRRLEDFGAAQVNLFLPGGSIAAHTEGLKRFREVMDGLA